MFTYFYAFSSVAATLASSLTPPKAASCAICDGLVIAVRRQKQSFALGDRISGVVGWWGPGVEGEAGGRGGGERGEGGR